MWCKCQYEHRSNAWTRSQCHSSNFELRSKLGHWVNIQSFVHPSERFVERQNAFVILGYQFTNKYRAILQAESAYRISEPIVDGLGYTGSQRRLRSQWYPVRMFRPGLKPRLAQARPYRGLKARLRASTGPQPQKPGPSPGF